MGIERHWCFTHRDQNVYTSTLYGSKCKECAVVIVFFNPTELLIVIRCVVSPRMHSKLNYEIFWRVFKIVFLFKIVK